ncbi:MAG: winged helix-turn-helix domain-containing protein [Anaerolineae bacterium]|nr:winged helix-turn-helix domain-containing protein [Anaerolineae bacterium]
MLTITNPFFHRGPVRNRAYFFGRKHETSQMLSLLGNGQSVSLVGQRRIGKTSLLFHILDPEVFTRHGLNPQEHLFVYIDCSGLSNLDQPDLYRVFLEEISDALADRELQTDQSVLAVDTQPSTYRAFERSLRQLIRQGWKPIILLDEFERMSRNPQLDPDFFSGLRALAAKYPIAYITASKLPLLALTYADASTLSSPFFNIFASIRLSLFSEADARSLLTGLSARGQITFAPATLDHILDLVGPHPLFLQIAGFHAFELRQVRKAALTDDDHVELRHRFHSSVEEHFGYYWRTLSDTEQRVLANLPAWQDSQPDIIRRLEQGCLIVGHDEGYDYLSSTFRDFVQAQPIPGLLKAGPIAIDESRRQAFLRGQPLNLTATQYSVLLSLVEQAEQIIPPEALEQAVWGDEYIEDPERLKSVLKSLRRALGDEAARLENVRGVGYVWRG